MKQEPCQGIKAVIGAQSQVVRMKMVSEKGMKDFLERQSGYVEMKEENGIIIVYIKEAGLNERYVRFSDLPFEVEMDEVKKNLEKYGIVTSIKRDNFKNAQEDDDGYFNVPSGWDIEVTTTIEKDIPSYITVEEQCGIVQYQAEPKTCRLCNQMGHIACQCPKNATNKRRWENLNSIGTNGITENNGEINEEESNKASEGINNEKIGIKDNIRSTAEGSDNPVMQLGCM